MPPGEMMGEERTIIGFLFDGFEFGDLWLGLTDKQREEVKTAVFNKTLEMKGLNPKDYPDLDYFVEEKEETNVAPEKTEE